MSITTSMAITEADENAIRDLVALAQESQSDPEALMALHTAETVIVNLAGRRVLGRETYSKALADALASPLSDVLTTAEIVDLRLATPGVAIVSATKAVHDRRSGVDASTGDAVNRGPHLRHHQKPRRVAHRPRADHTDPHAHQRRLGLMDG